MSGGKNNTKQDDVDDVDEVDDKDANDEALVDEDYVDCEDTDDVNHVGFQEAHI